MKNLLTYSLIFIALGILASCEDKDYNEILMSSTVTADVDEVTIFDTEFDVKLSVTNADITKLDVKGGSFEQTVDITEKTGKFTLKKSHFGKKWKEKSVVPFSVTADFGSHKRVSRFNIMLVPALSAQAAPNKIAEYNDSTKTKIKCKLDTKFKKVSSLKVERGVRNATTPIPNFETLKEEADAMKFEFIDSISGAKYTIEDTIVYKISAVGNGQTEEKTVEIPVVTKGLPDGVERLLSSDLESDSVKFKSSEKEDVIVAFSGPRGITSDKVRFVKIVEGTHVEKLDTLEAFSTLVRVINKADDEGELSNSLAGLEIGDMIAFTYKYEDGDYYGTMKITDVTSEDIGDGKNGIIFVLRQDSADT